MDLLPKEIAQIVYRYLFDDVYTVVKEQYKYRWLNDMPSYTHDYKMGIYWNEQRQRFFNQINVPVANWRNPSMMVIGHGRYRPCRNINRFDQRRYDHIAQLPFNY